MKYGGQTSGSGVTNAQLNAEAAARTAADTAETTARQTGDATSLAAVTSEASTRSAADTSLASRVAALEAGGGGGGGGGTVVVQGVREPSPATCRPLAGYQYMSGSALGNPAYGVNTWIKIPLPPGVGGTLGFLKHINWRIGPSFDSSEMPSDGNAAQNVSGDVPDPVTIAYAIQTKAGGVYTVLWKDGSEFATIGPRGELDSRPFRFGEVGDDYLWMRSYAVNAAQSPNLGFAMGDVIPGSGVWAGNSVSFSLGETDKRYLSSSLTGGQISVNGVWPFALYSLEPPMDLAAIPTVLVGDSRIDPLDSWVAYAFSINAGPAVPYIVVARATEPGSSFLTRKYSQLRQGMIRGCQAALVTYGINDLSSQTQVPLLTIQNLRNNLAAMLKQCGVRIIVETSITVAATRIDPANNAYTPENQMHGIWQATPTPGVGHPRAPSEPTRQAFNTYMRNNTDPTTKLFTPTAGGSSIPTGVKRYFWDEASYTETVNSHGDHVWATDGSGGPITGDGLHANTVGKQNVLAPAAIAPTTGLLRFFQKTMLT